MADQGSRSRGSSLQADSGSPRTALTDSSPEQESSTQTTGSRGRARGLGRGSPRNPQATTPGPACRPNPNQARIGQQDNESGQYADYVVVEKTDGESASCTVWREEYIKEFSKSFLAVGYGVVHHVYHI